MLFENGNILCMYIEESNMFVCLPQQRGLIVNLDIIHLEKHLNNLCAEVHHAVAIQLC